MPFKHIISMFEQKIAKNFEKMVFLQGNLPFFFYLHIRLFKYV